MCSSFRRQYTFFSNSKPPNFGFFSATDGCNCILYGLFYYYISQLQKDKHTNPRTVPKWELYGGKLFRFRPLRAYPAGLQLRTATMEGTESLYLLSSMVCAEHLLSGVLDVGLCGSVSIESAKQDHHCLYYYNIGASHKTIGIFRLEVITL